MTNPTACRELKPCPFCGSPMPDIVTMYPPSKGLTVVFAYECNKCGCKTPWCPKDEDASLIWNTRAPEGEVVACRLFDGEGGYMYTDDEETIKRWTKVKDGWTDLLYTHPPRATSAEDARDAARYRWAKENRWPTACPTGYYLSDGVIYPSEDQVIDAALAKRGEVG